MELLAWSEALEATVNLEVFADCELRIDRGELWANPESKASRTRVLDNGNTIDEYIARIRGDIAT